MIHASTGHSVAGGMKPVGCYPEHMGIFFPTAAVHQTLAGLAGEPGPGPAYQGMPLRGVVVGGPEQMIASHRVGPQIHPVAHVAVRVEPGETVIAQPTVPGNTERDHGSAATAQANPHSADPLRPHPPGVFGPGRACPDGLGQGCPAQAGSLVFRDETGCWAA